MAIATHADSYDEAIATVLTEQSMPIIEIEFGATAVDMQFSTLPTTHDDIQTVAIGRCAEVQRRDICRNTDPDIIWLNGWQFTHDFRM